MAKKTSNLPTVPAPMLTSDGKPIVVGGIYVLTQRRTGKHCEVRCISQDRVQRRWVAQNIHTGVEATVRTIGGDADAYFSLAAAWNARLKTLKKSQKQHDRDVRSVQNSLQKANEYRRIANTALATFSNTRGDQRRGLGLPA